MTEPRELLVPNPLVSRERPVWSCTASAPLPGRRELTYLPAASAEAPSWLALHVGVGPRRAALSWALASTDAQLSPPRDYVIETSADSSTGYDGSWREELNVSGNTAPARAHSFEFDGQSWVRLRVKPTGGTPAPLPLRRLDVHDVSDGCDDSWCFIGNWFPAQDFAEAIYARYPGYFPLVVDATSALDTPRTTLERLPELLRTHAEIRHFVLGFTPSATFEGHLQALREDFHALIDHLSRAGRVPVLALPDGARSSAFSLSIAELARARALLAAAPATSPRLHLEPPESLWADAMDELYAPV